MSLIYLLRDSVEKMPRALYAFDDSKTVVVGIEDAMSSRSLSRIAEILRPGSDTNLTTGQSLTYSELLDLVMKAGKVITL